MKRYLNCFEKKSRNFSSFLNFEQKKTRSRSPQPRGKRSQVLGGLTEWPAAGLTLAEGARCCRLYPSSPARYKTGPGGQRSVKTLELKTNKKCLCRLDTLTL